MHRLTRNRRRQLEAYLWERVYEETVKNCRELALFLSPHLLWVDDSDINGNNGLYVEREIVLKIKYIYKNGT